ncbi:MAG: B12-binding domain-containing radical SAM protein [Candidatus Scalindua rubra]|uniref:Uncharacterized protein n=1 Tax=Candidatus Scalindua brodae TaxID=237368 RepID=A0A0B0EHT7_9BACT|nr:MAG: hypothetical protein SCABRO_01618 [Candidatus Scalindua brodae]MBZ0109022.1 B12-binding domain-containing radical SAM protein [Candidatus Scalindua rubra]
MSNSSKSVVLVGFQDQGNLGLGYLAAILMKNGYYVQIVDIKERPANILRCIKIHRPILVGFSLIFQYYIPRYTNLASFLKSEKVDCHMTVGGHYPSLRHEQILNQIPELDSVVLFEGEQTLLDLANSLSEGDGDWHQTEGIAYRENDRIVLNPLRPLIPDLDKVPFPHRTFGTSKTLGKEIQPVLATRGCPRNCAFCSIREFYGRAPGKLVRRRSPVNVVREMRELYEEENVSIFLFQDDDFPLIGKAGHRWVCDFITELKHQGLVGNVIWKISCRVDEIEAKLFADMRAAGLYLVYLGIESGTITGLKTLNKQVTVEGNVQAVATLKDLNLMFGYGFMLFDPGSTFDSVRANIRFLREIIGDGSAAAVFCKMLPYSGTPIEKELVDTGRLKGSVVQPDYDFFDPALNEFYEKLTNSLASWIHGPDAISNDLNMAWHEIAVIKRLFTEMTGLEEYEEFLRSSTQKSNEHIFRVVEEASSIFEKDKVFPFSSEELHKEAHELSKTLLERRNSFVYLNQDRMLANLTEDTMSEKTIHL